MNGYDLSRRWFDFAFENKECKVQHTALFMWIIELNNRLGWKKEFGLPTADTMEGLSIGNKNTYLTSLKALEDWGFIEIVKAAKNQFQSCIISICRYESEPAQDTALDTALIQHSTRQCNSTDTGIDTSTVPIDKPINKETTKPINKETKKQPEVVFPFESKEFLDLWDQWKDYKKKDHRFRYKSAVSEQAALKKLNELSGGDEPLAMKIINQSIECGWKGLFNLKEENQAKKRYDTNESIDRIMRDRTDQIKYLEGYE